MKKLLMTVALALTFALPIVASPTTATANTWSQVNNPGYWADLYSAPGYRQGQLRCRVPHGNILETAPDFRLQVYRRIDGKDYYHVYWKRKIGVMEWHWRDAMTNGWCPIWNRKGWVNGDLIKKIRKPGGHWIN